MSDTTSIGPSRDVTYTELPPDEVIPPHDPKEGLHRGGKIKMADKRYNLAQKRKQQVLGDVKDGMAVRDAVLRSGVTYGAYEMWRKRDPNFAGQIDAIRADVNGIGQTRDYEGSDATFFAHYFKLPPAGFHMTLINAINACPPGKIVMALCPPDHAKTTTFVNHATKKLGLDPSFRFTVAGEDLKISKKILGRIKNRLELSGPYPEFVRKYGPFAPQTGAAQRAAQPWGAELFNVYKKSKHDDADYSVQALGRGSSIVSTRTDHLHCDDLQSTKTQNQTPEIMEWFRQDALSRPGTKGITTVFGTRVCEGDFYEELADDDDLSDILTVIRFPAIVTDQLTGEQRPLWPEMFSMEDLDMQRRKVGADAWDRNYMQNPGASRKKGGAFDDEILGPCLRPLMSLKHTVEKSHIVYMGLDPALGGKNCIVVVEILPQGAMVVRKIQEVQGLERNTQIMEQLEQCVIWANQTGRVTDVVIEQMNFQKGLVTDERLQAIKLRYGFNVTGHLTGWNKYDENIGVASMAESFIKQEILLPWADDPLTRNLIGELIRQLKAWKPMKKGNRLRQDMVMALWFAWILWRTRFKSTEISNSNGEGWKREGVSSAMSGRASGLILPPGMRLR